MEIKSKVSVSLTANEWELYTCSMKCGTAARSLNAAATKAINAAWDIWSKTKDDKAAVNAAWGIWSPVSNKLSSFGASDSEPRYHFGDLLLKLFIKPIGKENAYFW